MAPSEDKSTLKNRRHFYHEMYFLVDPGSPFAFHANMELRSLPQRSSETKRFPFLRCVTTTITL